ncbi:MAG TPA: carboxypeptidase-like regulatory domain-containing protein [Planctomycetota bacterium]|nr:carboxypeptidase-like regulatory domain-containing protein [Planctomycetota bacterium]
MWSRLKTLGWILAAVAPLALVWGITHPRHHPLQASHSTTASRPAPKRADPPPDPVSSEAATLSGELLDAEKRPLPGALVTLVDPEGRSDVLLPGRGRDFRDREEKTDDRGRFRFEALRPGKRLLIARPEGRPPVWTEPFLVEGTQHRVLTLPPPLSLTGLTHPRAKLSFTCRVPGLPHAGHSPVVVVVTADETGGYRVDGLLPPATSFAVMVDAPGYRSRSFGPYQFPAGRHIVDFDLNTGLTLRGTVRDGAGRPVQGALLAYDDARAVSEADGSFLLSGLEERTTTLIVAREGHIQTVLNAVRPGSIEVTLPRAAEVTGKVTGGRGRYLCFTVGDARYRMGLGESDDFRIPAVPPGPIRLDVEDEQHRLLGSAIVDAPEGGIVEGVEIQVR